MTLPPLNGTPSAAGGGAVVVDRDSKTVHLYIPRRTWDTSDQDFAAAIEEMCRLRREWVGRGYSVELVN
jgi:hypothetical protein